jgi:hypothetical protein
VIHGAARNGTLQSPELKRELVGMVCAYLGSDTDHGNRRRSPQI